MNEQKGLFTRLVETAGQYFAERRAASPEQAQSRRKGVLRWFGRQLIPNIGTLVLVAVMLLTIPSLAAPRGGIDVASTSVISYQGRLADSSGNPVTEVLPMIFRIYDVPIAGVPLWEESRSGENSVTVSDGLFHVLLGTISPGLATAIQGQDELYLGITVGADSEMDPRVQLGSVPFAVQALTVSDAGITSAKLADNAVTNAKMADNAVGSAEVIADSLTAADLAADSVTASEIAAGAVGTSEVADNSLTATDLAADSVGTSEIEDASITAADLAANSVTASEIAAGAVGTSEVADNSLTASDLAADSVGASEIAAGAVGTSEVADNALTANDLAADSVGASEIADGVVTQTHAPSLIRSVNGNSREIQYGEGCIGTTLEGNGFYYANITLPESFANTSYEVFLTKIWTAGAGGTSVAMVQGTSKTTTGFRVLSDAIGTWCFAWIAIGD